MAEIPSVLENPKAAINIAVGDPSPELPEQDIEDGFELDGVYFTDVKRYVFKKAKFSFDDIRVFDMEGELICNSHHIGRSLYLKYCP